MMYSLSGVCSKMAAGYDMLSPQFILFYGGVIVILGVYAIVWQQVLKKMPLVTAYANKAATVVWGVIWGLVIFHEHITVGKVISMILVVVGIVLFSYADAEDTDANSGK